MAQDENTANRLYETYGTFKEQQITNRRFKHSDLVNLIAKLKGSNIFRTSVIGKSLEGREIYLVTAGKGKNRILLWSQMHGDESTATMALFDIFNFLSAKEDGFDKLREMILSKNTLYFIPMLNPDGAERFQRRNALDIDLNRDAARLQMPEALLLKTMRDSLNADFGFNLHDQSTRYTAGDTYKSAALSFLAPAFNFNKDVNKVRDRSIKLIAQLNEVLSNFIPGHIAKYSDEFEPRAFGDNVQKWGTSTILIESGGWKNDMEKQFLRKLNYVAILTSFKSISDQSYERYTRAEYDSIPNNEMRLFDLIVRGVTISYSGKPYKVDIGVNINDFTAMDGTVYYKGVIEDIGDLSVFYGYDELNAEGMEAVPGKKYPSSELTLKEIEKTDIQDMLRQGYTTVSLSETNGSLDLYTRYPFILTTGDGYNSEISMGSIANFIISDSKAEARFAIVNGFIFDLLTGSNRIKNGLILNK